jgi:hypothetical protein
MKERVVMKFSRNKENYVDGDIDEPPAGHISCYHTDDRTAV